MKSKSLAPTVGLLLLLSGCAVRHIVDPNTGRTVSSSTDRKSDQSGDWFPQTVLYDGRYEILWCKETPTERVCRP